MKNNVIISLVTFTAVLSILLGLANNLENNFQALLLSQHNALGREHVELVLAERLASFKPIDNIWLVAKRAEITKLQISVDSLGVLLRYIGAVEFLMALSIVISQITILVVEVGIVDFDNKKALWFFWILLSLGVVMGFGGFVWFVWIYFAN